MRLLGIPVQFLSVFAISLLLTIYLGAWSAQGRIEERTHNAIVAQDAQLLKVNTVMMYSRTIFGDSVALNQPQPNIEKEWWENTTLFLCPLH
jgi:hypothetical protein